MVVKYCVNEATENCMIRLVIGPSTGKIQIPQDYQLTPGHGVTLVEGKDAVLFAYGPVMLHEALLASEILTERGFGLQVVNMPWLNRVDADWLREAVSQFQLLSFLEDHAPVGGLGDHLLDVLMRENMLDSGRSFKFAVEGYPACGTPVQALQFHRLGGGSLATRILEHRQ